MRPLLLIALAMLPLLSQADIRSSTEAAADTGGNTVGAGGTVITGSERASVRVTNVEGASTVHISVTPEAKVEVRTLPPITSSRDESSTKVEVQHKTSAEAEIDMNIHSPTTTPVLESVHEKTFGTWFFDVRLVWDSIGRFGRSLVEWLSLGAHAEPFYLASGR